MLDVLGAPTRHRLDVGAYHRMGEVGILGKRIELIDGALIDRDGEHGPARHKLNVDDYYRMGAAGILGEGDRVELIDGELIDMAPIGSEHAGTVKGLIRALTRACGDDALLGIQDPIRLTDTSEPQPDATVLRPRADGYRTSHPGPADILLLVEVADSSLLSDRAVKLPLYARAGIAEVWIVDVPGQVLEAHTDPVDGGFRTVRRFGPDAVVALVSAPQIVVSLRTVFGPG